jgi:hypothetical protein
VLHSLALFLETSFLTTLSRGDDGRRRGHIPGMSMFPDQSPPPVKPKLSSEERQRRTADRLKTIRLRMAIGRELDERGITKPAEIGAALGMPPAEAAKLLTRHQWREGDVEQLKAAAGQLGLPLSISDP